MPETSVGDADFGQIHRALEMMDDHKLSLLFQKQEKAKHSALHSKLATENLELLQLTDQLSEFKASARKLFKFSKKQSKSLQGSFTPLSPVTIFRIGNGTQSIFSRTRENF
jgi:hypothetical protein